MFAIFLQLTGKQEDYAGLLEALKGLGDWSTRIPNLWLVQSPRTSRQIRDALKRHLRPDDRLFVAHLDRNWSASNMGNGFGEWMARRAWDPPAANPVLPIVATPLSQATPINAPRRPKPRAGVRPPPKK